MSKTFIVHPPRNPTSIIVSELTQSDAHFLYKEKPFTSMRNDLVAQYPALRGLSVCGFNLSDVQQALGNRFETRLSGSNIAFAVVPQEIATRYGYDQAKVLMHHDRLAALAGYPAAKTFRILDQRPF